MPVWWYQTSLSFPNPDLVSRRDHHSVLEHEGASGGNSGTRSGDLKGWDWERADKVRRRSEWLFCQPSLLNEISLRYFYLKEYTPSTSQRHWPSLPSSTTMTYPNVLNKSYLLALSGWNGVKIHNYADGIATESGVQELIRSNRARLRTTKYCDLKKIWISSRARKLYILLIFSNFTLQCSTLFPLEGGPLYNARCVAHNKWSRAHCPWYLPMLEISDYEEYRTAQLALYFSRRCGCFFD
jgi:hypothetical protein